MTLRLLSGDLIFVNSILDSKLKNLMWITPDYSNDPIRELNLLKHTVNILKNDPDTFKAFQNVVIKDIQDSVTSPTTNAFDYTKFASYLKNNKQNLQTTFADDPKYIKNLEEFNDTLKILSRRNDDPIISQEKNALNDLIRARVGMFTLEGRLFTSAQKIFNYRIHQDTSIPRTLDSFKSQFVNRLFKFSQIPFLYVLCLLPKMFLPLQQILIFHKNPMLVSGHEDRSVKDCSLWQLPLISIQGFFQHSDSDRGEEHKIFLI